VTRSIPEKTLEHWTSMYLANRFPTASLWWPTKGEDVAFSQLRRMAAAGGLPSKVLLLELKTAEWVPAAGGLGKHTVSIDLDQLDRYLTPPPGVKSLPVYYVFPLPFWDEAFTTPATAMPPSTGGHYPPDWWRQAADGLPGAVGYEWFGNWTYVLPAELVARALPSGWSTRLDDERTKIKAAAVAAGRSSWARPRVAEELFSLPPTLPPSVWSTGVQAFWARVLRGLPFADQPQLWRDFWREVRTCNSGFGTRWVAEASPEGLRLRVKTGDDDEGRVAENVDLNRPGGEPDATGDDAQGRAGAGHDGSTAIVKLPRVLTGHREFWGAAPREGADDE
jgi:hypothetical protein